MRICCIIEKHFFERRLHMQISIRAVELVDNDRKKVLIQRAKEVKSMIYNSNLSLDGIIAKGYYLYKKNNYT